MPRLIQVIQSVENRGEGNDHSPFRHVVKYHDLDGNFLAEFDGWRPEETDKQISDRLKSINENVKLA